MKNQCAKHIYRGKQCSRAGKLYHKGLWYCHQHNPPSVDERRAQRGAEWDAKCKRADLVADIDDARLALSDAAEEYAAEYVDTDIAGVGELWLKLYAAAIEVTRLKAELEAL